MKNRVSFLMMLTACISVFSQDYKPLLDNINEWHFTTCFSGCLTDVYYTDGDTIVDGKNYKILDGYHYISRTFLLREEIAEKKVFLNIVSSGTSDEYLLYDFSLEEGEIFNMQNPITPFPKDGGPFILDSIVARPLEDGNAYRHFYFSPAPGNPVSTETAVWVEGVGSLSMINAPGGHPNINGVGHLSCFFKDTEIFYANLDSIADCTPIHLMVERNSLDAVILSKAFNGTECYFYNAENIDALVMYDLNGKILKKIRNVGKNFLKIDLENYRNGMYIFMVSGKNGKRKSFKLIK